MSGPVPVATALIKQAEEAVDGLWGLHHQQDCLAQEVEKVDKEWEQISNWVSDLLDQRADVRDEIWTLEQQLKTEKERLEASGLGQKSGHAGPVAPCSVLGQPLPKGASAEPRAPKKRVNINPESNLAWPQKRGSSTMSHT